MTTLVIARYNEDVTWLDDIKLKDVRIKVYNKGLALESNWIPLPNVGRESHTYISHIINNYDNLSPITVFLQASPFDHIGNVENIYKLIQEASTDSSGLSQNAHVHEVGMCNAYHGFTIKQHANKPVTPYKNGYTLGEWLYEMTGSYMTHSPRWYIGACFAATREAIRSVPLKTWQNIHDSLSYDVDPVTGHYMERSWYMLLTKNTLPIAAPRHL